MKNLRRVLCGSLIAAFVAAVALFAVACTPSAYTVKFMANGSEYKSLSLAEGTEIAKPEDPVIDGYAFEGWYADEGATGTAVAFPAKMPASDVTYYAKLSRVYTVTLMDGAEKLGEVTGKPGTKINYNTDKDKYLFEGWYSDSGCLNEVTSPVIGNEDDVLYAKYTRVYTINFVASEEFEYANLPKAITAKAGESLDIKDFDDEYYMLLGWYGNANFTGDTVALPTVMPAEDVTYYAKLAEKVTMYYVKHITDKNGMFNPSDVLGKKELAIGSSETIKTPEELGLSNGTSRFLTWTTNPNSQGEDKVEAGATLNITSDKYRAGAQILLYAQWADEYASDDAANETAKVYVSTTYFGEDNAIYAKDGNEIIGKSYMTPANDLEFKFDMGNGSSFIGMVQGNFRANDGNYHLRDYADINSGDYVKITRNTGEVSQDAEFYASGYKYVHTYTTTEKDEQGNTVTKEVSEDCTYGTYKATKDGEWYKAGEYFGLIRTAKNEDGSVFSYVFYKADIDLNKKLSLSFLTAFRFDSDAAVPSEKSGAFVEMGKEGYLVLTAIGAQLPIWFYYDRVEEGVSRDYGFFLDGYGEGTYLDTTGTEIKEVAGTYTFTEKYGGTYEGEWTFESTDGTVTKTFWLQYDPAGMGMYLERDENVAGKYDITDGGTIEIEGYDNYIDATVYTKADGTVVKGTYEVADTDNKVILFTPLSDGTTATPITDCLFFAYVSDNKFTLLSQDSEGFITHNNILYAYFGQKTGTASDPVKVPDGVTTVHSNAFSYLANVVAVNLNQVTEIKAGGFYKCRALEYADLAGVTTIGFQAFGYCEALTTVIAENVTDIGQEAFGNCRALKELTLPKIVNIGEAAFYETIELNQINIGGTIKKIERDAFYCVSQKTGSLEIRFLGTTAPEIGEDLINVSSFDTENGQGVSIRVNDVTVLKVFYAAPSWSVYRVLVVCDNINPSAYFGTWFASDLSAVIFDETSFVDGSVVFYVAGDNADDNGEVTVYQRIEGESGIELKETQVTVAADKSSVTIGAKVYKPIAAGTKFTFTNTAGDTLEFTHSGTGETKDGQAVFTPKGKDSVPTVVGIDNLSAASEIVMMLNGSMMQYYGLTVDWDQTGTTGSFTYSFKEWAIDCIHYPGGLQGYMVPLTMTVRSEEEIYVSSEGLYGVPDYSSSASSFVAFENIRVTEFKEAIDPSAGYVFALAFEFEKTTNDGIKLLYEFVVQCQLSGSFNFYSITEWQCLVVQDIEDAASGITLRTYIFWDGKLSENQPQQGAVIDYFDIVVGGEVVKYEKVSSETKLLIKITEGEKAGTYEIILGKDTEGNATVQFVKQTETP